MAFDLVVVDVEVEVELEFEFELDFDVVEAEDACPRLGVLVRCLPLPESLLDLDLEGGF